MLLEFEIRKALAFFPTFFPFIHLVVLCHFPIEYIDLYNILHICKNEKGRYVYCLTQWTKREKSYNK